MRTRAVRYLLWLLPIPNRDTLHTLLQFLSSVSQFSEDKENADGTVVSKLVKVHRRVYHSSIHMFAISIAYPLL